MTKPDTALGLEALRHVPCALTGSFPVHRAIWCGRQSKAFPHSIATNRRGRAGSAVERLAVTLYAEDFRFVDGQSSLFDTLDRVAECGADVRILFRHPNPQSSAYGRTFSGSPAHRDMLRAR